MIESGFQVNGKAKKRNTERHVVKGYRISLKVIYIEKNHDEDGIRTHAGRAQWISSPSP